MSVKHAGLLALHVLENIEFYVPHNSDVLFTPLAGAIWSQDVFNDLSIKKTVRLMNCLNASSHSGGRYLDTSDCAAAVIAVLVATRNMADRKIAESIVLNTAKQYIQKSRDFNQAKFDEYCVHATGGVPRNINVKSLFTRMEDMKANEIKVAKASAQIKAAVKTHAPIGAAKSSALKSPTTSKK